MSRQLLFGTEFLQRSSCWVATALQRSRYATKTDGICLFHCYWKAVYKYSPSGATCCPGSLKAGAWFISGGKGTWGALLLMVWGTSCCGGPKGDGCWGNGSGAWDESQVLHCDLVREDISQSISRLFCRLNYLITGGMEDQCSLVQTKPSAHQLLLEM